MVGLASASVVARVTGAPRDAELWLGAVIAAGLPDLDLALEFVGLRGPRFHRNASHSLVVIAAVLVLGWLALDALDVAPDARLATAWGVALLSHPLLDALTTGPTLGARGYGIGLFWPLWSKRWFSRRPVIDQTTNWGSCRTVGEVWRGVRPELSVLVPVCAGILLLALLA